MLIVYTKVEQIFPLSTYTLTSECTFSINIKEKVHCFRIWDIIMNADWWVIIVSRNILFWFFKHITFGVFLFYSMKSWFNDNTWWWFTLEYLSEHCIKIASACIEIWSIQLFNTYAWSIVKYLNKNIQICVLNTFIKSN